MSRRILTTTALLAVAAACSERATPPTDPAGQPGPVAPTPAPVPVPGDLPPEQAALEGLAREVALAMGRTEFRSRVRRQLEASPFREQKVHLQETLLGNRSALRAAVGEEARVTRMVALADGAIPAEVYFPVEAHRQAWDGGEQVLVATAMDDYDPPVAFDTEGRRYVLDAFTPPATPVLALVPRETPILRRAAAKCLEEDCVQPQGGGGGTAGGGSGGGGPSLSAGSLTLTHAEFTEDFEGWLKGKPEFEIHVLGPLSPADTATLTSYQCVGEHAPAPYAWDMNSLSWYGAAKVFTYEQMDAFQTAYPDRAFVIMALEDDTDACVITSDSNRFKTMLEALGSAYDQYTAAKDRRIGLGEADRILTAARTGADLLAAISNFITTRDDAIGIAVADTVAGRANPRGNWVVLNEADQVTGWLQLDMR